MKKIFIILFSFTAVQSFAQDSYRDKNYDEYIYSYQMNYVEENNISKDLYLNYSKSLSKWDTRPLLISDVWIMDELQPSSIVPNFFWGSFSRYFQIEIKDAMELPQIFLRNANTERLKYIDEFNERKTKFVKLTNLILQSEKTIFVHQENLKRVDNLYFENENYWSYIIPKDSPYPMSDSTNTIENMNFSDFEKDILKILKELGLYAIFNSNDSIYFLIDGLLDNSFGYIYPKESKSIVSNHLFEIDYKLQIAPNYYFYIAN